MLMAQPLLSFLPTSICCSSVLGAQSRGSPPQSHGRCSPAVIYCWIDGFNLLIKGLTHGRAEEIDSGEVQSRERGKKAEKDVKN